MNTNLINDRSKNKNLTLQNGSVLKTFDILDCFSLDNPYQRLRDICLITGMNRSTVLRFLNSLNQIGIVEKEQNGTKCGTYEEFQKYVQFVFLEFTTGYSTIL